MSKEDLKREEDLKRSFDSIALLVSELEEEKTQIEIKFGLSSKLRASKHRQQQVIKDFYKSTLAYINYMRDLTHLMGVNYRALELIAMQKETGLTWEKCASLLNYKGATLSKVDQADLILSELYIELKKIDPQSFK